MPQTEYQIRYSRGGKRRTVDPAIARWRKRMRQFKRLKAEIVTMLNARAWTSAQIQDWLSSPAKGLKNRTPRSLLNPRQIAVLHEWARKVLI